MHFTDFLRIILPCLIVIYFIKLVWQLKIVSIQNEHVKSLNYDKPMRRDWAGVDIREHHWVLLSFISVVRVVC